LVGFFGKAVLLALTLHAVQILAQTPQSQRDKAISLRDEGVALRNEGSKESLEKAIAKFEEARPVFHALDDRANEAFALLAIGRTYGDLSDYQKDIVYSTQALTLYRALGEPKFEGIALNNIATAYYSLGETQKAVESLERVLEINRAHNDRRNEALTLDNIGAIYSNRGEKQKALEYHTQALQLYRDVGDRAGEANSINNIGLVYADLGEKQKALDYYAQALPIHRALHDREGEAVTLLNIGSAHSALGEKQKALDSYSGALALFRIVGDRKYEASALNNIGQIYFEVGEAQRAIDLITEALAIKKEIGDRAGEADLLNNLGAINDELGEYQKALEFYAQALPLRRSVGDRPGEAMTLNNMGMVYRALVDTRKALDYFSQALSIYRAVGDRDGEALTLDNIGASYGDLGDQQKALEYYGQALTLLRAVGDRDVEAGVLGNVALIHRNAGNLAAARSEIEAAIAILESLRTKIINQQLRTSYFAKVQGYYEFYIDLLMRLHKQKPNEGHDAEALQASERARARALLEVLTEAHADVRQGVEARLVERERALKQQLNTAAEEQIIILSGPHTEEQREVIAKRIETLTNELQQIETQIRQTSPRYAALTQPRALTGKEVQTMVLDGNTILLEYSLGEERSYLWAVTQKNIMSYELPKRADIESVAREVYELFTDESKWPGKSSESLRKSDLAKSTSGNRPPSSPAMSSAPAVAVQLSQMILGPVAAQLGTKRLLVVADGTLQYLPFAALPVPAATTNSVTNQEGKSYSPLIVDHEIVNLPSASTLAVLRNEVTDRKPARKSIAIFADPVFEKSDPRLSRASNSGTETNKTNPRALELMRSAKETGVVRSDLQIPRLPGTRREAERILALSPAATNKPAFDFEANRLTATSADMSEYRFVHFATHGFLDSQHPELSGILLSMFDDRGQPQDGFLRAHEIFNLRLPADLVVLSACQTGLGKDVRGEGVVSLTRSFMYAGASRVVVSLWSVSDEGTAELMARFYQGMLKKSLTPAQALQAAQVSMFKEKQFTAPFYWAAFTLQGEWR